jgi:hypothetical protein
MDPEPDLSPYALTTLEAALSYLKRDFGKEAAAEDIVVLCINGVTGKMEDYTGRALRARTYRGTTTISCTSTVDVRTLTAAAGLNALKTLDDALGANLQPGTRVDSIESDLSLTLSKKAETTGAANVTFGSEPLALDGEGGNVAYLPERPVVEVYTAKWLDADGVKTALTLTGARLDKGTGRYLLPNDTFPKGKRNIEVECKAGVVPPTATDRGHWREWETLQALCLRGVQVAWQDYMQQVGRTGDVNVVQATQHIQSFKLPDDVREGLDRYARLW